MTQNIEQRTEAAVTKYEGAADTIEKFAETDSTVSTAAGPRKSFPKLSREIEADALESLRLGTANHQGIYAVGVAYDKPNWTYTYNDQQWGLSSDFDLSTLPYETTFLDPNSDSNLSVYGNASQWWVKSRGLIDIKDFKPVGDNVAYDDSAFLSAIAFCSNFGFELYISKPDVAYLLSDKIKINDRLDISCDSTGFIRWDSTDETKVGIEIGYSKRVQLCEMHFPCLMGPAIDSSLSLPGYGQGLQDPTTRIGTAVHVLGCNRLNITAQIANGFKSTFLPQSTIDRTCDNINFYINTSDFCERFVHADSTEGFGLAQINVKANTVWAKRIFNSNSETGYINGCNIDIEGTAFVNEDGGCGVYTVGKNLRSSRVYINQLQAGKRDDSRNDTLVTLIPKGTMDAAPVVGETITQATSGASGVVLDNVSEAFNTTNYFSVGAVSGTFDEVGELTGSTSGALGVGSVPIVEDLVCPWIGGDQTNSGFSDIEQSGTIGYFGGSHCEIEIGAPMDHPVGNPNKGAFSVNPSVGQSLRLRDAGLHNQISVKNIGSMGNNDITEQPVILSDVTGETNFGNGKGYARWSNVVYCNFDLSSGLAPGAVASAYLYHTNISPKSTLKPIQISPRNSAIFDNQLELTAFIDTVEKRRIRVQVRNNGAVSYTGPVLFHLKVAE